MSTPRTLSVESLAALLRETEAALCAAAAVVWIAGIRLSDTTDVLSSRLGLGEALGGLLLLAVTTNLPADLDLSGFRSVVVYRRRFTTVFSTAELVS